MGETFKSFMLHYNFPPYSVGETRPLRGPGRREIGHGALAERAISQVLPSAEEFPYTIRIVSEILSSNGSSSMATICGASMSLMDAGVPIKGAVAGVAMGLIKEEDRVAVLSDILGDEDQIWATWTSRWPAPPQGITALQMDIKMTGLTREIMAQALTQAREARLHILGEMNKVIAEPSPDLKEHAPKIIVLTINPDKIREVIGPGGKMVKSIVAATGIKIDIEDDGKIHISSSDQKAADEAIRMINEITEEAEIGKVYHGIVKKIMDFGAFVEIIPGTDGLVHISELAHERVQNVTDVLKEGDELDVKVLDVDRQGKIRLSRRALLPVPEGMTPREPDSRPSRSDRDRRPGRGTKKPFLNNGLRVVTEELPYFHSVAVGVWLNVGSRDETRAGERAQPLPGAHGLQRHPQAHRLRHRPGDRPDRGHLQRLHQQGADLLPRQGAGGAPAPPGGSAGRHDAPSPLCTPRTWRRNARSSWRRSTPRTTIPKTRSRSLFGRNFWGDNPLGRPILGEADHIAGVSREDLLAYRRATYRPEETVVAAAGRVDHQQLVDLVAPAFPGFRQRRAAPAAAPGGLNLSGDLPHSPGPGAGLSSAWAPGAWPPAMPRRFAATMLQLILGGNMSSRLFQVIREQLGLAYSIYAFLSFFSDTGLLGISAGVSPKNLEALLAAVCAGVKEVEGRAGPGRGAAGGPGIRAGLHLPGRRGRGPPDDAPGQE